MGDERRRELERRFRATGAAEDEAPLLRERLRLGELSAARLELAAYLGHHAATLACSAEGLPLPTIMDLSLARFPPEERAHWQRTLQEVIDDPGRALIPGLADLERPAWSLGLAHFGGHVCLRAVVAGSSVLLDCARRHGEVIDAHLQLAASAVRGDPAAKVTAAQLPRRQDLFATGRLQQELCATVVGQDPDAPRRLAAAVADLVSRCGKEREQVFQDTVRAGLLPWVLKTGQPPNNGPASDQPPGA